MTSWKSLLFIHTAIDVRIRNQSGEPHRFVHELTDAEVLDGVRSFQNFPVLVEGLTSRRTSVSYEITAARRPLTSLTRMREDMYWPSPDDTREEIDRFACGGFYDSLFILWPQQNLRFPAASLRLPIRYLYLPFPAFVAFFSLSHAPVRLGSHLIFQDFLKGQHDIPT